MFQPDPTAMLVGAAAFLAVVVVMLAVTAVRRHREGRDFEVRPLRVDQLDSYRTRMDELQALFVTKPRRAVAGARQLVDDMLAEMGYPARLGDADRVKDIAYTNRGHARRYRTAMVVDDRSSTEEMRQAMEHFLALGRELVAESEANGPAASRGPGTPAGAAVADGAQPSTDGTTADFVPVEHSAGDHHVTL